MSVITPFYITSQNPPNEILAKAIHIDTVKISHAYHANDLPPPVEFEKRGFDTTYKSRKGNRIMTARSHSLKNDSTEPQLSIVISEFGYCGIKAEVSLAKMIDRNGLGIHTQEDIESAFDGIEDFIRAKIGVNFNARTAKVNRFDANADFLVGEGRIQSFINAISRPYARLTKNTYGSTTLYYRNKSRAFTVYGKKEEMKVRCRDGKATFADIAAADGLLRVEARLMTTESNKRFAEKLTSSNIAEQLLTLNTASIFVKDTIHLLGLDKSKIANEDKEMSLKDTFGKDAPEMFGILAFREYYGEDFWKIIGWSAAKYYRKKKELKDANLWDVSPTQELPTLVVKPDYYNNSTLLP